MIISAHQPAYNPWLGYFHKILISDIFVIMDDVQFEKNSFINRNKILQNNNEVMLTIPIKTKDYKSKTIKDMEVVDKKWKIKHFKSIKQAYMKSQNFDLIFPKLEEIYTIESNYMIDYTNALTGFLISFLDIKTKIIFASELNLTSKKLNYVVELTKTLDGTMFVFGSQGKDYADINYLKQENIIPYFQEYNHPEYKQLSNKFHPFMGILDLIFNEEKDNIKNIILSNNPTKEELRKKYV